MIITVFFISSILLVVEVGGKKYKEHSDSGNTVIILTTGGISAKVNHKDNGLVRFPRGESKSDSPISIEVKGMSNSENNRASSDSTSKLMRGFSPSYGNGIPPYSSLDYLYGNHVISMPSIRTRAHMHMKTGEKSESPEAKQNEDKNSYLGYYDHHHYHYFRNGQRIIMDHRGRPVGTVNGEVQHEPPVGDDFHGHGHFNNGANNEHSHNYHQNHHNGGDNGHGNNHNNGDNGYYYHGHYGPEGVVHFQSGNSEGHGHGHGGHSYSYGNGDGYYYHYGNDGRGNGYHYHSNDNPQENYHNNDLNSNGPHHRPQEFGFHEQQNNFNSHGAFRPPEGVPENNLHFHADDQGHNYQGFANNGGHFDAGQYERYPSDRPISEPHFNGHNFRPPGHPHDFPQQSHQNFGQENHNFGAHHNGHSNFGAHGYPNAHFDAEHRQVAGTHNHFLVPYKSDSPKNSLIGYRIPASSAETEFILKTRLQNPYIGDIYESATTGDKFHGVTVHNSDFFPSEQETDGFRYGEPGGRGGHLNQRQHYRPVHTSGDYGHRVYYGNALLGHTSRSIGGYAKRFGYSAKEKKN